MTSVTATPRPWRSLVPQAYNAERFECDLSAYPRIQRIVANCRALPAFAQAAPEAQPDAG